ALKKIALLARQGKTSDAYREYGELFTSHPFAGYRLEDQRQALKLMLMAKEPAPTDDVLSAYAKAVTRLEAITAEASDPSDYELLGVGYVFLEKGDKATE